MSSLSCHFRQHREGHESEQVYEVRDCGANHQIKKKKKSLIHSDIFSRSSFFQTIECTGIISTEHNPLQFSCDSHGLCPFLGYLLHRLCINLACVC